MYKIIVTDLDGTLLTPDYKITSFTKNVITKIYKKGVHFIIASGRSYEDVSYFQDFLGIRSSMITSNGAKVYNSDRKLIFSKNLKESVLTELCRIVYEEKDILTHLYCYEKWYTNRLVNNDKVECYNRCSGRIFKRDLCNINKENVSKVFFTSSNIKKLIFLQKEIFNKFGKNISMAFSLPNCLEVMDRKISKGKSLGFLVKYLGESLQNCISFGDGMNDEDMLFCSGKACIMKNGDKFLKKRLSHIEIIGSNKEDAVACYLKKIFF